MTTQPQPGGEKVSRTQMVWLAGVFLLVSAWMWTAFLRGRVASGIEQLLLLLLLMWIIASASWLVTAVLRRHGLQLSQSFKKLAYSSSAFLLLAVFFPEYLLGRPPLVRSLLLLGFSLLLFSAYLVLSLRKEEPSRRVFRFNISPAAILITFCVLYFVLTSWVALAKLRSFGYVGQDIAYFTQCLYTTLHGHIFYSNMYHDLLYGQPVTSDFAGHNQLVLFLFLPFFVLHKTASTLLILRNIFIVLCAWPVYLIGRRHVAPGLAALPAAGFLLVPAVLYQNFYDFAPLSVAGLPLLFALYYYLEDNFAPCMIALLCAQIVREDLAFAIFGLGLLALWQRRGLRWVVAPCMLAFIWAFISWKIMFPHYLRGATSPVAGCFSYLGLSPAEMLRNAASQPGMLLSQKNLLYTKQMVDPFGGILFLLNPAWFISVPYIGINLLAEGGGCNTAMIYRHYSLIPAVFLFAAVLLALKKLSLYAARRGHRPGVVQAAALLFVLAAALSSMVFVTGQQQFQELKTRPWHAEANQIAQLLPPNAAVAAPRYLLPRLAVRDSLYQSLRLLEYHYTDASYIVIDKDWQRMAAAEQWHGNYDALRRILATSPQYRVTYDSPNYVIYKLCDRCVSTLPHREPVKETHD